MRNIAGNIRAARKAKGITQDSLAEKLHTTRQTVSNYETGRSRPDVEMLMDIAEALDTDIQELLYGAEPKPSKKAELRTLLYAVLVLLFLGALLYILQDIDARLRLHYVVLLGYIVRLTVCAGFYSLLGWALMQAGGIFLGAKPLSAAAIPYIHKALWILLGLYSLLILPYTGWFCLTLYKQYVSYITRSELSIVGVTILSPVIDRMMQRVMMFTIRYPVIFLPFGASLWFTKKH